MTTILLTLGRLPKALDLARGFARVGCRVIIAEPFPAHLAGASRYVSRSYCVPAPASGQDLYLMALSRIVTEECVDLVVPISEETMHVAFLRDRLPGHVGLFTMPPEQVLALYDKRRFVDAGIAYGVAVPTTFPLGTPDGAALAARQDVVVKPIYSCSGRGVTILRRGTMLPEPDPRDPAIVQAFIAGEVYSSCSVAHDGRPAATILYRGTVMSGTVAVAFERVDDQPAIMAWIERFVRGSGWTGFISFDFVVDATGTVFGIECNPRTTSGLHFWQSEDLAAAVLGQSAHPLVRLRPERVLQQFYSCLTETQMALFRRDDFIGRLKRLFTTRDVTWEWCDPWPFLTMIVTSWRIIVLSILRRTTFGQVATLDIGWRPDGI